MKRCQKWIRILQDGEMNRMAIERIMVRWSRVGLGALVLSLAAFCARTRTNDGSPIRVRENE